jgi:hypothetical protein
VSINASGAAGFPGGSGFGAGDPGGVGGQVTTKIPIAPHATFAPNDVLSVIVGAAGGGGLPGPGDGDGPGGGPTYIRDTTSDTYMLIAGGGRGTPCGAGSAGAAGGLGAGGGGGGGAGGSYVTSGASATFQPGQSQNGFVRISFNTVDVAPQITSASGAAVPAATGQVSFQVTSTGSPAPEYSLLGSPPSWLSIDALTGLLSGTIPPGTNGSFTFTIEAANGVAPSPAQPFTLSSPSRHCS